MLSRTDVENLMVLARLDIDAEERDALAIELDSVLGYVSEIQEAMTEEEPIPEAGFLRNVMREDGVPHAGGQYTDAILANMPDTQDGFLKVKQIL